MHVHPSAAYTLADSDEPTLLLPAVFRDPANVFDICDLRVKVCF